jgi:DNA-binding transcriptional MerR regulator
MPLSRARDYLSIGEVLDAIKSDFPDISVSKIRFLESEGLISPERTESGYRKFYENDVARLRHILSLQRDHFLPLKVIKERLARVGPDGGEPGGALDQREAEEQGAAPGGDAAESLSRKQLLKSSGLDEVQLAALEEFGVLERTDAYDGHHLAAARAAREMFRYGIEARHLRMYRQIADRESAFFEQIVSPVTQRRDRAAHDEVVRSVGDLLKLSRQLREGLLRTNLRELT